MKIALYICLGIVGLIILFFLFGVLPVLPIAIKVHKMQLKRGGNNTWGRECSCLTNEEQVQMWNEGMAWFETVKDKASDVETIAPDGIKLVGQYFNFGGSKCVMILGGRCESLCYSYYYAKPYVEMGYNILLVDGRAHGNSEGEYNCVGCKEYKDILGWIKKAHDEFNNEKVLLHGICIGAATSTYVATSKKCPDYVEGLIVDGLYYSFYQTFANHMKAEHRPVFPFCLIIMFLIGVKGGKNPVFFKPGKLIKKYKGHLLMIHSKMDVFSLPYYAERMYESCPSSTKRIEWFDVGAHSHVRINNTKRYDEVIKSYVENVISK
ncbi:MAG: hypothetical protein MJ238_05240 [Bacilli bacterium]|nr:hypothetical protein [Bacilli bacterium]